MKKTVFTHLVVLVILLSGRITFSQQRMQYSQFLQNGFLLNPAVAGMEKYADLKGGFSRQWAGFDGAPQGQFVTFHKRIGSDSLKVSNNESTMPLRGRKNVKIQNQEGSNSNNDSIEKFHTGYGISIFSEGDDIISQNEISASYAMHFPLKNHQFISGGASLGLRQNRFDPTSIKLLNQNDLIFGNQVRNILMPNLNLGVLWYSNKFFVGLSVNQVLNNSFSYDRLESIPASSLRPHFYLNAGYKLKVGESLTITPSIIARNVFPAPMSFDLNVMADYKDLLRGGISYRNKESIIAILGICVNHRISINYSFDYVTAAVKAYGTGTHGIILGARLGKKTTKYIPNYFW